LGKKYSSENTLTTFFYNELSWDWEKLNMKEFDKLTKRERDVLGLIIAGKSNPEIAKDLNITIHTVKAHIESIYYKFDVHNRVQAAVLAVTNDIV